MSSTAETLATALREHQAGRLDQAEYAYRRILAVEPREAEAWHLLGVVACQRGRFAEAAELIARAVSLESQRPVYHNNLGVALRSLERTAEAAQSFIEASRLAPSYAEAHDNAASTLRDLGRLIEAETHCRRAIELKPDYVESLTRLGTILRDQGRLAEALAQWQAVNRLAPAYLPAYANIADLLNQQGRPDEAVALLERALAIDPNSAMIANNLGMLLSEQGSLERGVELIEQALRREPQLAEAYTNLGNIRFRQARFAEAVDVYRRALAVRPRYATAFSNLGAALVRLKDLDGAIRAFGESLRLEPDNAAAYNNLGTALKDQGRLEEGLRAMRRAVELDPAQIRAHSSLLYCLNYSSISPTELLAEHRRWEERHAPMPGRLGPLPQARQPERRLRIGYVSPDFHDHPVTTFLESGLAHHDRSNFEIVIYSDTMLRDTAHERLRALGHTWRDTFGWSDADLADKVRADRIDVLVELAGHTAGHRLRALAERPAPVQVSYLGYPATTGLATIDYRLTDEVADPPGANPYLAERPWRLPIGFCCFRPPQSAPSVSPLPAASREIFTFGSAHHLAKMNDRVLALWARLLARVPHSRLMLVRDTLFDGTGDFWAERLQRHGIAPDRYVLMHTVEGTVHLPLYHEFDLSLDVFPWSGHTTACESLFMGVPVVTLRGERFAGRMVASVLTTAGMGEWIADDEEAYLEIATRLAGDRVALARIRATLRERMVGSPLCDGTGFARRLESAFRQMWRDYCAGSS